MRKITDKIREKKRLWLSRGLLFISLFLLFALVSCEIFNQSTRWYLRYYSENALLGRIEVEEPAGSYSGITCIESNDDKTVTLYMINPEGYDLFLPEGGDIPAINFDDPRLNDLPQNGDIIFRQDSNDKSLCTLTFKKNFLECLDNGIFSELDSDNNPTGRVQKNISCTITLSNGFTMVEPFHLSLYVNSLPPRIQGAMFQKVDDKYVVCFNIPDIHNTVHEKDTKDLTVGGEHFKIDFSSSNPVIRDMDGNIAQNLTTTNPGSDLVDIDGATTAFISLSGCTQFYYYTDIRPEDSSDEIKYKITLTDDYKFTKEVTVSSQMAKLEKPTIDLNQSTDYYVRSTDGKYDLTINHSGQATYKDVDGNFQTKYCSSPVIEYKIFTKDDTLVKSGSGRAPVKVPLNKGKYYVEAYAQAPGFADSNKNDGFGSTQSRLFIFYSNEKYYVDEKKGNSSNNASSNYPLETISQALNMIQSEVSADLIKDPGIQQYKIILLSDIETTSDSLLIKHAVELDGNNHKIDAKGNTGSALEIIMEKDKRVIIKNLTITGAVCDDDTTGALNITASNPQGRNSFFVLENCTISGNTGYGVYGINNVPYFVIAGNTQIINNKDTENKSTNIYIPNGKQIVIGEYGFLPFSGRIGFTTQNPPETGKPIQITTHFKDGAVSGLSPYTSFIPDNPEGSVLYKSEDGEVYYSSCVSSFEIYNGEELIVSTGGTEEFTAGGTNGTITVSVQNEKSNDITSQCSFGGHMIMYMSGVLNNSGPQGNSTNYYYTANGNKVTLKSTLTEKGAGYALFIQVTYKGVTYDALLPFKIK